MILDPAEAARVEAAFDAAQLKTRAPLVCVLAGASTSRDAEFLLGACILALATPLPLLLFTELSAHRIYVAQLLVAILAAVLASLPRVRRLARPEARRPLGLPSGGAGAIRPARARPLAMRRARLCVARRTLHPHRPGRGGGAGGRPHEQWQAVVDEALGPLADGATEAALTGLAEVAVTCLPNLSRRERPRIRTDSGSISSERQGAAAHGAPLHKRLLSERALSPGSA